MQSEPASSRRRFPWLSWVVLPILIISVVTVLGIWVVQRTWPSRIKEQVVIKISGRDARSGHYTGVNALAFSPDSETLAAGLGDGTIHLFDRRTGAIRATLISGVSSTVLALAFSPDGKRLASGSSDGFVQIWDVTQAKERSRYRACSNGVWRLAFTPDGNVLVVVGFDGLTLQTGYYDIANNHQKVTIRVPDADHWMGLSSDGRKLATTKSESAGNVEDPGKYRVEVKVWDTATGRELASLPGYTRPLFALAFSHDGMILATDANSDEHIPRIRFWDASSGKELSTFLSGSSWDFLFLVFSPDSRMLAHRASIGEAGAVRFVEPISGQEQGLIEVHVVAPVECLAFSPDGTSLATANSVISHRDGNVRAEIKLWDVRRILNK